jgi:hypothetical protein
MMIISGFKVPTAGVRRPERRNTAQSEFKGTEGFPNAYVID